MRRRDRLGGQFFIDVVGGVEVFGGDAEGFEEGDVGGRLAAGFCVGEDFAEFGLGVAFGDVAFFFGNEEVAGFVEKGLVPICEDAGAYDGVAVDLAGVGGAGAGNVEVGAGREPVAFDDGLGCRGDGADDVGVLGGLPCGVGDADGDVGYCFCFLGEE